MDEDEDDSSEVDIELWQVGVSYESYLFGFGVG